jgi:hypothetical protein
MTMHPDTHAPHPCRAFDDPEFTMPPKPSRLSMQPARARPAPRRRLALRMLGDVAAILFAAFGFVALAFGLLIVAGDDRAINAWGLWFRAIVGG